MPLQPHYHRAAGRLRPRTDHRRLPPHRALRGGRPDRGEEGGEGLHPHHHVLRRHPGAGGAVRADPGPGGFEGIGADLRLRPLPPGKGREGGHPVDLLRLPGRGQGAERRGHVPGAHLHLHRHLRGARLKGRNLHGAADSGVCGSFHYEAAPDQVCQNPRIQRAVLRRPHLGDRVHRRRGHRRAAHGDENVLPLPAHLKEPWHRPGTEPNRALVHQTAHEFQALLR